MRFSGIERTKIGVFSALSGVAKARRFGINDGNSHAAEGCKTSDLMIKNIPTKRSENTVRKGPLHTKKQALPFSELPPDLSQRI